jgi:AcrR family transcriptional regulator
MSSPPIEKPGLRERNKQDKLDRIKRAARALFSKRGFHETTIRAIAARAGVATGTVFLYAKDKADLLQHLFSEAVTEIQEEAFATLPASGPADAAGHGRSRLVDQLVHVFGRFLRFYDGDRDLSRLFIKELLFTEAQRSAQHFALTFAFLDRIGALVAAAQERGEIRGDVAPQPVASLLFGTYFLSVVALLDTSETMRLDAASATEQLRGGLTVQIEGLRPQHEEARPIPSPEKKPRKPRK